MSRILVVEDDADLAFGLSDDLRVEGYEVEAVSDGEAALERVRKDQWDLILLDIMLPRKDGFEVCRELRRSGVRTPIIILTARVQEAEKVLGLELGADDYVTKPFNPRELVARIKAILRRTRRATLSQAPVHVGDVTVDPARHEVIVAGRPVDLRPKEFDLLLALAEHRGIVLSREQLLDQVWGYDFYGETRTVDVHIAHLRKRLAGSSTGIETVVGVGYKLVAGG